MSIEEAEFRRVLGHFPTGVAIVAARDGQGPARGLTANSVTSVSLDPPLVLVCVERTSDTHPVIEASRAFAVSVLGEGQETLARRFATYEPDAKFDGVAYRQETTGAPILEDALAWVDCRLWAAYDGGDHTIFVGLVEGASATDGPPLLYYRGGYGRLGP